VKKILSINPSNRNDIFDNVKVLSIPPRTFFNTKNFLSTGISFYWNYEFCKKVLRNDPTKEEEKGAGNPPAP
jgi:hypothetical protein